MKPTILIFFTLFIIVQGYSQSSAPEKPLSSIYPNPFTDSITIEVPINFGDTIAAQLSTVEGEQKLSTDGIAFYRSQNIDLATTVSIDDGLYVLTVWINNVKSNYTISKSGGKGNVQISLDVKVISGATDVLILYPNPTDSELNLILQPQARRVEVSLYDLKGRRLLSEKITHDNEIIQWSTTLKGLEDGIYILEVMSGRKKMVRQIIKNK